jgi:uncharacterized membrane protein
MTAQQIILVATATSTALIAGLFYSYSCSVNLGLGKLPDAGYIAAMQSINKEILNPLFFASFMGTLLLLPISAWLQYKIGAYQSFHLLVVATLVYAVGVFGVTLFGNVPLNNALAGFNLPSASIEAVSKQRARFEIPWNRLHTVRTIFVIISLILVIIALLKNRDIIASVK